MKVGIFFYSRTGITKKIAHDLHELTDSDIFCIDDKRKRKGVFGFAGAIIETILKSKPSIKPMQADYLDYSIIVIGTPIWGSSMASPVRTFITKHRQKFKKVAFFCTHEDSGDHEAFMEMKQISKEPTAMLSLTKREIDNGKYRQKLSDFAKGLEEVSIYR
ncbi:hypothetical protein JXM83_02930 [Candidatus Woesearchaeota archaeon]|nr:hypothetical protein [Candidatus Woesearchaeota archaeon]